ncbi:hypothetical protein TNCV_2335821 [Trichonephila clavipes]|uniref:Uncharacterized protein n=1 Tax=Trichonephila clavipes TaxID=2585209 RepID=A0A8X6SKY4_TRICX|nr:hypothetical protein TNCV_2335821 [Trichonephila clavipes]
MGLMDPIMSHGNIYLHLNSTIYIRPPVYPSAKVSFRNSLFGLAHEWERKENWVHGTRHAVELDLDDRNGELVPCCCNSMPHFVNRIR